ncbi:Arogenate dehydrogenase 2, chloroplastic [Dichanthelium oligosanthes]|uniref:Arogenate dehydrogenase 2, chloroplastic n=1 Tax=Dichanthelium oligosanthes TaxID=888268 RepID=A0A1E5WEJ5_9POAL|nr:Arogenate dehydrogenase 2, chloroplastic [Dichanthelium oligosanthes]
MASSLRHFAGLACFPASHAAASSGTTCHLLRRHAPDFCVFAALRPIRPPAAFSATNACPSPAEQHQHPGHQEAVPCHDSDPPALSSAPPLRVGILGFGNFGQFIAGGIQRQGHAVLAASRSDYSAYCADHGISFFRSVDALCDEQPDVLLICSSILSTESVVRAIPFHKLRPDTIVADVLSVKQFPRNLLLEILPPGFGIVCTHPMFGPESGKHGWSKLPFVYDKVRVAEDGDQAAKCDQFLSIFEQEGCRMVEMSCAEHDRYAAGSQFITHTVGRVLSQLNPQSTPINTKGYETLLQLTFIIYAQLDNLERAFEKVRRMLYGRLHDLLRRQIVERVHIPMISSGKFENGRSNSSTASFLSPAVEEKKHVSPVASVTSLTTLQPIASSSVQC